MKLRRLACLFLAVLLVWAAPGQVQAAPHGVAGSIQKLVGEDYRYAFDFLIFTHLAEGQLRFSATDRPGVFRAELTGRTLGFVSWLTGERTQTYSSLMEMAPDGSLRSIEHESRIVKSRWGTRQSRVQHSRYDYEKGTIVDETRLDDLPRATAEYVIPGGQQPVDILTALYNLRAGVYGALVRGASFRIPSYSGGKFADIEAEALTFEKQREQSNFPAHGLLVRVNLDSAIFDFGSDRLYVWFDEAGVPRRGVIEDLIGKGDIRGYQEGS